MKLTYVILFIVRNWNPASDLICKTLRDQKHQKGLNYNFRNRVEVRKQVQGES